MLSKILLSVHGLVASNDVSKVVNLGLSSPDDKIGWEILLEVLGCVNRISQQLGKTTSSIIYELLMSMPAITSDDFLTCLLKILETGYSSLVAAFNRDSGADIVLEKELLDHKNLRKFSVDMLLSLHSLSNKAGSWARVLEVIEGYINFLVPHKTVPKFDSERPLDMKATILIHSISQIARVMFESANDVLLFLGYLVNVSWQVRFS